MRHIPSKINPLIQDNDHEKICWNSYSSDNDQNSHIKSVLQYIDNNNRIGGYITAPEWKIIAFI